MAPFRSSECSFRFPAARPDSAARPRFHGSADALAIAELAGKVRPLVVITAGAADAQRLLEEIRSSIRRSGSHLLPDWETLPYDSSRRTRTWSPSGWPRSTRSTQQRLRRRDRAGDHRALPAAADREYLAAHTFFFKQGEKLAADELRKAARRSPATPTSRRWSRRANTVSAAASSTSFRWAARCPTASTSSTTRSNRSAASTSTPSAASTRCRKCGSCRRANSRWTRTGQTRFRQNFRTRFEGDPSRSRLYKDVSNGIAPAGIEYYLPLFFEHTADPHRLPAGEHHA